MEGSALRDDADDAQKAPGWAEVRQRAMVAAEACAVAALGVTMRGPHGVHAAAMMRQASEAWRMTSEMWRDVAMRVGQLRQAEFNEAVIDAERQRAADEALAAAGVAVPAPRPRHLRSV